MMDNDTRKVVAAGCCVGHVVFGFANAVLFAFVYWKTAPADADLLDMEVLLGAGLAMLKHPLFWVFLVLGWLSQGAQSLITPSADSAQD